MFDLLTWELFFDDARPGEHGADELRTGYLRHCPNRAAELLEADVVGELIDAIRGTWCGEGQVPTGPTEDDDCSAAGYGRRVGFNEELFDRVVGVYDESPPFFTTLGRALVEAAGIPDESTVIDLGAGKGAVTIALRAALPRGAITAVDVSSGMLAAIDALDLDQVDTVHADLIELPLADRSFDHAVSGFSLHILADQRAAFQEIHRVLRPGASLTWSLPGSHQEAREWSRDYAAIYQRYEAAIRDVPAEMTPAPDLDALLLAAGFSVDAVKTVPVAIPVGDAEGYWRWTQSHGARWLTDVLPPQDAQALHREVVSSLQRLHPTQGAHIMVAPQITRMLRT